MYLDSCEATNMIDMAQSPFDFTNNELSFYCDIINETQSVDIEMEFKKNENVLCKDNEKNNNNNNDNSDNNSYELMTCDEIYDMIRNINDPEHPLTLEQLNVVTKEGINFDINNKNKLLINFTPTIPHCSMATLIGLCIKVKLMRSLPQRFKINVKITKGTHQSEDAINKQLNDKERVAAAMENPNLINVVNRCILTSLQES